MKYFLIEMDRSITNAPSIINWYKKINANSLKKGEYYKISYRTILNIDSNPNTIFVDVMSSPFFLVTKDVKKY